MGDMADFILGQALRWCECDDGTHTSNMGDWFKLIYTRIVFETEKAWLVEFCGRQEWFPKSKCVKKVYPFSLDDCELLVQRWLLLKKGIKPFSEEFKHCIKFIESH